MVRTVGAIVRSIMAVSSMAMCISRNEENIIDISADMRATPTDLLHMLHIGFVI